MDTFAQVMMTDGAINVAHYSDPKLDALVTEAFATIDPATRLPILEELFLMSVASAAYIPWGMPVGYIYWWPWVTNFYGEKNTGTGHMQVDTLWIDAAMKKEMGY
jgi:ABC-type transport system substrate-binding protein